tara:strand:- start:217 stop:453 length:237 start_codon:yes stop_codon:yes gene_type:complete
MQVTYLKINEELEVDRIPVKVVLLCELYRVISRNQRYLEYLNSELNGLDERLVDDIKDTYLTLSVLELQTQMGVKYAR